MGREWIPFPVYGRHGPVARLGECLVCNQEVEGPSPFLLDGELFLPEETWDQDRARFRAAGIPDDVVYRPKWQIALGQVPRALGHGVRFSWWTFDEGYGGKPPFLRALDGLGQNYVAELPSDVVGGTRPPEVLYREYGRYRGRGRCRKFPRLKVRHPPAAEVREILKHSPILRGVPWERFRVKDGSKGPMVWEAKRIPFWIKDENGRPSRPHHLMVARKVLKPEEMKFFLSNAPEATPVEVLGRVTFSRWPVERLFKDRKTELGLDHFDVRQYPSIVRHLILTCISHFFLAEFCLTHRGKKSGVDPLPGAGGQASPGSGLDSRRPRLAPTGRIDRRAIGHNPAAKRRSPKVAPKANHPAITWNRRPIEKQTHLQVAKNLAL